MSAEFKPLIWRDHQGRKHIDAMMFCIHEAGHAVAALTLGFRVLDVRIEANSDPPRGLTRYWPDWPVDRTKTRENLIVCWAGPAAQVLHSGSDYGCDEDFDRLERLSGEMGLNDAELHNLRRAAEDLLRREHRALDTIARELLATRGGPIGVDRLRALIGH
jgi:hypothetical protein